MTHDTADPIVPLAEAATRMGVNERRARNILTRSLVRPVRTPRGIGYRLDDVLAVKKAHR